MGSAVLAYVEIDVVALKLVSENGRVRSGSGNWVRNYGLADLRSGHPNCFYSVARIWQVILVHKKITLQFVRNVATFLAVAVEASVTRSRLIALAVASATAMIGSVGPAFAHDAVRALDGRVRIFYKQPSRSGKTFADVSRDVFLARLCAFVPPPGVHMVRYYGVLASGHRLRSAAAPKREAPEAMPKQLGLFVGKDNAELLAINGPLLEDQLRDQAPSRIGWAKLLARVFQVDVTVCRRCGGPMRILRAVTLPDDIAAELHGARAPPRSPLPGQLELLPM